MPSPGALIEIQNSGDPATKVDFLIVGDGYTIPRAFAIAGLIAGIGASACAGGASEGSGAPVAGSGWMAGARAGAGTGALMVAGAFVSETVRTGMFFGAGAALLCACMLHLSSMLRGRDTGPIAGRGAWPLWRLGFRAATSRPSRTVLSAALIASAAFIVVSVEAFRRPDPSGGDIHSGTGGFALIGQSEVPLLSTQWKLRLGVANDYNSQPGRGVKRLDTTYFTRLVLNWK